MSKHKDDYQKATSYMSLGGVIRRLKEEEYDYIYDINSNKLYNIKEDYVRINF